MFIKPFFLRRILMVCLGVFVLGFSISLLVYANFGSDPCTCMNLGVASRLGLTFGTWQLLFNCIVLVVMFFVSRRLIGIGTVINMVSIGFLVDFFRAVYAQFLPASPAVAVRAAVMAAALVLLSFGAALYMHPGLGVSPYDSLSVMAAEKLRFDFKWCRVACDLLAVVIGFLCGSVVGVGTAVSAFCMGPLIKFFANRLNRAFPLPAEEQL